MSRSSSGVHWESGDVVPRPGFSAAGRTRAVCDCLLEKLCSDPKPTGRVLPISVPNPVPRGGTTKLNRSKQRGRANGNQKRRIGLGFEVPSHATSTLCDGVLARHVPAANGTWSQEQKDDGQCEQGTYDVPFLHAATSVSDLGQAGGSGKECECPSPKGRGSPAGRLRRPAYELFERVRRAEGLPRILPLPLREGRGEGNSGTDSKWA